MMVKNIEIGTHVHEKDGKTKSSKRRERVIFTYCNVNGARILNVKWDNGTKDSMDEWSVELVEDTKKKKKDKKSIFSMLTKSPVTTPSADKLDSKYNKSNGENGITGRNNTPTSVASSPTSDDEDNHDSHDYEYNTAKPTEPGMY